LIKQIIVILDVTDGIVAMSVFVTELNYSRLSESPPMIV